MTKLTINDLTDEAIAKAVNNAVDSVFAEEEKRVMRKYEIFYGDNGEGKTVSIFAYNRKDARRLAPCELGDIFSCILAYEI